MRVLLPLPSDGEGIGLAANIFAFQAKRFRDAKTRTIKQCEHRRVARDDPRLACLAFAQSGSVICPAAETDSGFGKVLGNFGVPQR